MYRLSPVQCAPEHLFSWWFRQSQFDEEFDKKQRFIPLINQGWLEKISTLIENEIRPKKDIYVTLPYNKIQLPLQVQCCNPCQGWDRVFLAGENWPQAHS